MNWFTSMFSAESQGGDFVDSSRLNITKITALLVPLTTAGVAVLDAAVFKEDGILAGLTLGQKLGLVISLIAFVAIVVVADMTTRARATTALLQAPIVLFPSAVTGTWERRGPDLDCSIVGARGGGSPGSAGTQILIVATEEGRSVAHWVAAAEVNFL